MALLMVLYVMVWPLKESLLFSFCPKQISPYGVPEKKHTKITEVWTAFFLLSNNQQFYHLWIHSLKKANVFLMHFKCCKRAMQHQKERLILLIKVHHILQYKRIGEHCLHFMQLSGIESISSLGEYIL